MNFIDDEWREAVYPYVLRRAQRRAVRKGMSLRVVLGGGGYSLDVSKGWAVPVPPLIFQNFMDAEEEIRMR